MIYYIAGPMSGYPLYNFPAFDAARDQLIAEGHQVISPADLDRAVGFDPATSVVDKQFLEEAMQRDLDAIMRVDAVVMLPGWETSTGATAEYHLARWRHVPVKEWPSMRTISEMEEELVGDPKAAAGSKKCPLHLLPVVALEHTAWVHLLGSNKYGPFNWRETGVSFDTYHAAIMRHLFAVAGGRWLDPESGKPHMAHIAASANILMDAFEVDKLVFTDK